MKAILLAAGQGQRLRPLTDDRPKCMVEVGGRPLLHWQLDALRSAGIDDIVVVRGWCRSRVVADGVRFLDNRNFATTNMVESLRCARRELRGDVLVAYTDLLYDPSVLRAARASGADIAVPVDLEWRRLWERRLGSTEAVLADAESLRLGEHDEILDIGRRVQDIEEIQAQYMGLLRLSPHGSDTLRRVLREESARGDAPAFGSERSFDRACLTDLLQHLVASGEHPMAVPVRGGWCEVDSPRDREVATELLAEGHFPGLTPTREAVA